MNQVAMNARDLWMSIPAAGRRFSKKQRRRGEFLYNTDRSCTLALLELFGLMTVEKDEPDEGQGWQVAEVRHTPFGDELLGIVFGKTERELFDHPKHAVEFGAWQPLLQPYFPQWVDNLEFPQPEFRDGVYYFKVSLGKPWRRIAAPAKADLDDLAWSIIAAFDFDGDHLYGFRFAARNGCRTRIEHPCIDDADAHTDELRIGELPLKESQSMEFEYDFGANWQFDVQLEKVEPDAGKITEPTVVQSRGKAPPEYEYYDDEW